MSGSSSNRNRMTLAEVVSSGDAFMFRVEGTASNHRAVPIRRAVDLSLPGTRGVADPGSRSVSATGMSDYAKFSVIVGEVGHTAPMPRVGEPNRSRIRTRAQGVQAVDCWAIGSCAVGHGSPDAQGLKAIVSACIGSAAD
jgi:hypothetical protein